MKPSFLPLIFSTLFIILSSLINLSAQECGTESTPMPANILHGYNSFLQNIAQGETANSRSTYELPLKIHIIRTNSGTGGLPFSDLTEGITLLNEAFEEVDIYFYQCGETHYIDDSDYYTFQMSEYTVLADQFNDDEAINVYFANEIVTEDGDNLAGFATYPWANTHVIFMGYEYTTMTTFAHEMGHFLGLPHTHDTTNGAELANGSNCNTAGDSFCDTPADPNISGLVNSNCEYIGTAVDASGQNYDPDPTNYMSYSRKTCRYHFTPSQIATMIYFTGQAYSDLTCNINNEEVEITLFAPIAITPSTIICGEPFSIHTDLWNTGSYTFYGDFTAAIFDENFDFVEHIQILTETNGLPSSYHYTNGLTFSSNGLPLASGNYYIKMFALPNDGTDWIPVLDGDYENGVFIEVNCGTTTPVLENEASEFTVKCFPNPANDFVNLEVTLASSEIVVLEIFAPDGKQVHGEQQNSNAAFQINVQDWVSGIYFYRLVTGDKVVSGRMKVR